MTEAQASTDVLFHRHEGVHQLCARFIPKMCARVCARFVFGVFFWGVR